MEISGKTGLTGLIGSPVSHSISPRMHNLAFELLGIDCVYLAFDVGGRDLGTVVRGLRDIGIRGFNVTMPCKVSIMEFMDELTDAARLAGSCNTVIVGEDGRMTGHTTDGIGFMRSVRDYGCELIGKKISILGAGGAAKSVIAQAALDGVGAIDVFRRSHGNAFAETEEFAERIGAFTGCSVNVCGFDDTERMRDSFAESAVLVNATNVGMAPHDDECPISDPSLLHPGLFVYDIIYNPRRTRLIAEACEAGCRVSNGVSMILFQGAASFECWTGREMPVEEIRDKLF